MPNRNRERVVQISARQMVEASMAQTVWRTLAVEERKGTMPSLALGAGNNLFDLSLLWNKIGSKAHIKIGRERLELIMPNVLAFSKAIAELEEKTELAQAVLEGRLQLIPDQSYVHEVHAQFEKLAPAEQATVLQSARTVYATCCVQFTFGSWMLQPGNIPTSMLASTRNAQAQVKDEIESIKLFFELIDWSVQSRQLPADQKFLPAGFWPRGEPEEQPDRPPAEDEELELGQDEIAEDDVRVDADRDAYYMGELSCLHRLEPQGWFSNRRYVAYIYRAPSSEMIAILDCAQLGNAAYIFRVGVPVEGRQPDAWMADASQTKLELLTRPEDRRGTFVRRFIHAAGWQVRLKSWLEGTFPAASS